MLNILFLFLIIFLNDGFCATVIRDSCQDWSAESTPTQGYNGWFYLQTELLRTNISAKMAATASKYEFPDLNATHQYFYNKAQNSPSFNQIPFLGGCKVCN
jgi:hypothetical protein